jgi:hypothetical protein
MQKPILRISILIASILIGAASLALSCDDEVCQEPDPRGEGQFGDACVYMQDCAAGLVCIGTSFVEDALCASPLDLPGAADPGCLEHADDWLEHESDGVQPVPPDDEGCERLVFVSSCNCQGSGGEDCVPVQPLYRREIWRRCNDCCWRLVSFWHDDEACEEVR